MANYKRKYETAEEIREARRKSTAKYYEKNKEKRKAYFREYYRKNKENKEGDK